MIIPVYGYHNPNKGIFLNKANFIKPSKNKKYTHDTRGTRVPLQTHKTKAKTNAYKHKPHTGHTTNTTSRPYKQNPTEQ
jgi:hypothetical protein